MKKRLLTILSVFVLGTTIVSLQSCKTDCEKYCDEGYCSDGDCKCWSGYAGKYCDVYVGTGSTSSSSGGSSSSSSSGGGSSSSSSSSSSGGGGSYGKVTFWTESDQNCGNITVKVTGYSSKYITSYYYNGLSGCDRSGCANYTLSPGTYTYTASCSGYTWGPSTFTITAGGCLRYELY